MNSIRRFYSMVLTVALFLFMTGSASAQIRTVLVSPVPGNPVASGTALRNAIAGIASPSATNRWLVKIEPGTYDIGTTSLPMRSFVDVEGSGIDATTIRGTVNAPVGVLNAGTVNGASNTELRLLTIANTVTDGGGNSIALYNEVTTAVRLYRVKLTSYATSGLAWGMRNAQSAPLIEECEVSVTATNTAYGIVYRSLVSSGERSSILRSKIAVWGANENYGIFMIEAQTLTVLRDSRIDVTNGSVTYGLYATPLSGWSGTDNMSIRDTEISSAGGSTASYGAKFESGATVALDVTSSKILGHVAPTTYGVLQQGFAPMGFQDASIVGFTKTIESVSSVSIATTHLNGGPVTVAGWVGCMGVWDENGVFFANSCP